MHFAMPKTEFLIIFIAKIFDRRNYKYLIRISPVESTRIQQSNISEQIELNLQSSVRIPKRSVLTCAIPQHQLKKRCFFIPALLRSRPIPHVSRLSEASISRSEERRGGNALGMCLVLICMCLLYLDLECSQVESRGATTHHTCTRIYPHAQHASVYLWVLEPSLSEPDVINKSNICCDNSIRLCYADDDRSICSTQCYHLSTVVYLIFCIRYNCS